MASNFVGKEADGPQQLSIEPTGFGAGVDRQVYIVELNSTTGRYIDKPAGHNILIVASQNFVYYSVHETTDSVFGLEYIPEAGTGALDKVDYNVCYQINYIKKAIPDGKRIYFYSPTTNIVCLEFRRAGIY